MGCLQRDQNPTGQDQQPATDKGSEGCREELHGPHACLIIRGELYDDQFFAQRSPGTSLWTIDEFSKWLVELHTIVDGDPFHTAEGASDECGLGPRLVESDDETRSRGDPEGRSGAPD